MAGANRLQRQPGDGRDRGHVRRATSGAGGHHSVGVSSKNVSSGRRRRIEPRAFAAQLGIPNRYARAHCMRHQRTFTRTGVAPLMWSGGEGCSSSGPAARDCVSRILSAWVGAEPPKGCLSVRCCPSWWWVQGEASIAERGIQLLRRARKGEIERAGGRFFKPLRQSVESIFDTLKGQLDLEQHGGHTPQGVLVRVLQRMLAMTTAIWHNDRTGQPVRRSLLAYDH